MTRTTHYSAEAGLPVYAVAFVGEDELVYAGGGGAGRSGVGNAIRTARIETASQALHQLHELKLSRDEDAPMCMSVNPKARNLACGINSPSSVLAAGQNENLRIFDYTISSPEAETEKEKEKEAEKEGDSQTKKESSEGAKAGGSAEVTFKKAAHSLNITDPEQYQKVSVFSRDGRFLAVGSTDGKFALHRYPSLFPAWTAPLSDFAGEELYDADFDEAGTLLVVTSGSKLRVYSTSPSAASSGSAPLSRTDAALEHNASEGGGPAAGAGAEADDPDAEADRPPSGPDVIQTIQNPAIGGRGGCTFRAARFGRGEASKERLFTVVNAANAQGKGKARKSFVTAWDADSWELIETRNVSDRPVTVFDVSADGRLLAYGSSDLSVGVLDARTLRPILRILHAHDFPPTCLRFSPSGTKLVSASADNMIRVITVPDKAVRDSALTTYTSIALALLLLLLAILVQRYFNVHSVGGGSGGR